MKLKFPHKSASILQGNKKKKKMMKKKKGHLQPTRIITIQKKKKSVRNMEKKEPLQTLNGNVKWYTHYGKQYEKS